MKRLHLWVSINDKSSGNSIDVANHLQVKEGGLDMLEVSESSSNKSRKKMQMNENEAITEH